MNKSILAILGLLISFSAFSQKTISNTKNNKHQQVNGTKFFLIPPEGFTMADSFQGFQLAQKSASVLVMEIPGPLSEVTKGLNEEGLKSQGVILKNHEEANVNGYDGSFITAEQSANGTHFKKYILVFGDEKSTNMVIGMYPSDFNDLETHILESVLSVIHEPDLQVDPLSAVNFKVYTENTKLRFAGMMSGSLLYTVDGKVPTESNDKTSFIIGQSHGNGHTFDKKQNTINRLKGMPYNNLIIEEDKVIPIEVDDISGYEIESQGFNKTDGDRELVYHAMLYTDDGYYLFFGTAKDNFEDNLNLFKQITRTFERKQN